MNRRRVIVGAGAVAVAAITKPAAAICQLAVPIEEPPLVEIVLRFMNLPPADRAFFLREIRALSEKRITLEQYESRGRAWIAGQLVPPIP